MLDDMKIFRDLTEEECHQLHDAIKWCHDNNSGCASPIVACVIFMVFMLFSCRSVEYVPVESNHVEHHWHHDSVEKIDTFIKDKVTTIRELDSAAMAEYGIRLNNAERAFLVQTKEFERQIQKLLEQKSDTVIKVDSVQVPVPIERKLSRWEQTCLDYGRVMMGGTIVAIIVIILWIISWIKKRIRNRI